MPEFDPDEAELREDPLAGQLRRYFGKTSATPRPTTVTGHAEPPSLPPRRRRALGMAVSALLAMVVAAAVAVPVALTHRGSPVQMPTSTPTVVPTSSPSPTPAGTFSVSSVTFSSPEDGWVLGSQPCGGSPRCLALMRTQDGGKTWTHVPPPPTHLNTEQPGGVLQVRFANSQDGWAFDPELWSTHNDGATWTRITLPGVSSDAIVGSLETAQGQVVAAVLNQAMSVRIETSTVGTDGWHLSPTSVPFGAGPAADPQLVLQGNAGWLLMDNRTVMGGARLVNGSWLPWQPPCENVKWSRRACGLDFSGPDRRLRAGALHLPKPGGESLYLKGRRIQLWAALPTCPRWRR